MHLCWTCPDRDSIFRYEYAFWLGQATLAGIVFRWLDWEAVCGTARCITTHNSLEKGTHIEVPQKIFLVNAIKTRFSFLYKWGKTKSFLDAPWQLNSTAHLLPSFCRRETGKPNERTLGQALVKCSCPESSGLRRCDASAVKAKISRRNNDTCVQS